MRRAVLLTLIGLALGGCLEKVEPISNTGGIVRTGFGSGSVTLTWQPPTQNADGSPLLDLAGYNIYVGTGSNSYNYREIRLDNPGLTSYVVENLEPDTYFIVATAFNSMGFESHYSDELVKTVD